MTVSRSNSDNAPGLLDVSRHRQQLDEACIRPLAVGQRREGRLLQRTPERRARAPAIVPDPALDERGVQRGGQLPGRHAARVVGLRRDANVAERLAYVA